MTWLAEERGVLAAERILDAAGGLFAARGVGAVDMGDIARAAGCSRATLYRYFENRRALHEAFVQRAARRVAGEITAAVEGLDGGRARVAAATLAAVRLVRADPVLAAWFTAGDAGTATGVAGSSELIQAFAAGFLGDPADPDVQQRGRWLVRCIVSLLALPPAAGDDEPTLVDRFVVPVVTA